MNRTTGAPKALMIAAACCLLLPVNACAYLDAGSGSYMIQILIASLIGAGFAFKAFWVKMIRSLTGLFRKKKDGANQKTPRIVP